MYVYAIYNTCYRLAAISRQFGHKRVDDETRCVRFHFIQIGVLSRFASRMADRREPDAARILISR